MTSLTRLEDVVDVDDYNDDDYDMMLVGRNEILLYVDWWTLSQIIYCTFIREFFFDVRGEIYLISFLNEWWAQGFLP